MSTLIVDVCAVEETAAIDGADRIERVRVKNWWCVAGKGHYKVGDKAVYVPPDSVIPPALAERWGIAKYCSELARDISGERPPGLRVRAAKFRGAASFGTIQDPDDPNWAVGTDVREHYGITKYEPPVRCSEGDAAPPHPAFHEYSSLERFGDYPGTFADGERVVVTEKIHGTNSRVGWVLTGRSPDGEDEVWEFMAGSHANRRKEFNDKGVRSLYWLPLKPHTPPNPAVPGGTHESVEDAEFHDPLRDLIVNVWFKEDAQSAVIVFGEIFGAGVQDMQYGQKGKSFRLFDIAVDGTYLDHDKVAGYVAAHEGVEMVPVLYDGPFSRAKMDELVDGPTTVCETAAIAEPFKGREGVVIKPEKERFDPLLGKRAVLKYVSADYHARKNKDQTEDH
jgi:hypothetical protein